MKKVTYLVEIEMPDRDMISAGWIRDLIQSDCDAEGYRDQTVTVKDTVLTWEDVRSIVKIADHIITRETGKYPTEQSYYEEVLKRFNEARK